MIKQTIAGLALCAALSGWGAPQAPANAGTTAVPATQSAPATEEEYVDFLYAHMSVPDSLDLSRDFYRQNVEAALRARREMPWGAKVPEREWRHFVLPVRVNNENLDTSRVAFYAELAPRVKDMSMTDAALEVNHWCHEKVTYRPSDGRTLSPLACAKTAWGRCGEESTFAVAALRSVGIPARQVYTPRWAHTDDNHAWVEVWTDGQWHFLGACEPEPILDLAWFNAPAARGMLMATNVHGRYDGPEEVLVERPLDTRINVTANYAPVDTLTVRVVRPDGSPAEGAQVDFTLYNYSELYPLATRKADAEGLARLTAGRGDLLVWASDGKGGFGVAKATVGARREPLTVTIDKDAAFEGVLDFDLVPPKGAAHLPAPTPEQAEQNAVRLAREDSMRRAYMATFFTPEKARELAAQRGWDAEIMERVLPGAHGNHATLVEFLETTPQGQLHKAQVLLDMLAAKDLCDISLDVLQDAMLAPSEDPDVLNPRVANEMLVPNRAFFNASPLPANPDRLAEEVANLIGLDGDYSLNPSHSVVSAQGVYRHHSDIDPHSRDVFYVNRLRAAGVPSRIDPVTGKVQWRDGQQWRDVDFSAYSKRADSAESAEKADGGDNGMARVPLSMTFEEGSVPFVPKYYSHFTLAKIDAQGRPVTLGFDEMEPWDKLFAQPAQLEPGQYMLLSGQRMADGTVLARSEFFRLDKPETVALTLRQAEKGKGLEVIGSFNSELAYNDATTGEPQSFLSQNGRGYFVVGLLAPNNEPSVHALNDLSAAREALGEFPSKIFLIYPDEQQLSRAGLQNFTSLPENVLVGYGENIPAEIASLGMEMPQDAPVFIIADTFNRVVFLSHGYTIGLGETLANALNSLK